MFVTSSELYNFGSYSLDMSSRLLTRSGEAVTLAPKTFDLLAVLVKSNGRLLSKSELMDSLWPGTFVEEANLSFQISTLRRALGEDGVQWIETVPKHGYRFTAEVKSPLLLGEEAAASAGKSGSRYGRSAGICRQQPWRSGSHSSPCFWKEQPCDPRGSRKGLPRQFR
jgi:DNA-binding winged helix-turn-helix (wHTH) protein